MLPHGVFCAITKQLPIGPGLSEILVCDAILFARTLLVMREGKMPCWARCLLGMWWIWGIGSIVAALIGLASAGVWGLLAGLAWFAVTIIACFFVCWGRCGGLG